MLRSTPLQVESVVKIAPESGGSAKIFPQRKHPARVIINASLVFIFILIFDSWGGHSRGDPRRLYWLVRAAAVAIARGNFSIGIGASIFHRPSRKTAERSSEQNFMWWCLFLLNGKQISNDSQRVLSGRDRGRNGIKKSAVEHRFAKES